MAKQATKPEETATIEPGSILCKFQCTQVENRTIGADYLENMYAAPVTGDSPDGKPNENESFSKLTPAGVLHLVLTNPDVEGFFKSGKRYLVRITEEEVPVAPVI